MGKRGTQHPGPIADDADAVLRQAQARLDQRKQVAADRQARIDAAEVKKAEPKRSRRVSSADSSNPQHARHSNSKPPTKSRPRTKSSRPREAVDPSIGQYDGGLAEFPAFRFGSRRRADVHHLEFEDTIMGADGKPLDRVWKVYPGPDGFGGALAQGVLFDLHQIWKEDGFRGHRINFGTIRKLYQRSHPGKNPRAKDYADLRRALDVLCGYQFDCENSFWDPVSNQYGSMRRWSLFTGWFEARKKGSSALQDELPFGFIEVSDVFARVAVERGFFVTGFDSPFFHGLKPTAQRLALYLSKMFASQTVHRRNVTTLAAALPIEDANPRKQRHTLKAAMQELESTGWEYLRDWAIEPSRRTRGEYVACFRATKKIPQNYPIPVPSLEHMSAEERQLIEDIVTEFDDRGSETYWAQKIQQLGPHTVRFEFADLAGAKRENRLKPGSRPAALLNVRLKKHLEEQGISITHHPARHSSS